VFFAVFFLISKRSRDVIGVAPFLLGTMAVASTVVALAVLGTGQPVLAVTPRDLLLALGVAVGPGAVGHLAMTWPLRWVPANVPPVVRLCQPVLAGLLAWGLLGEAVTGAHLAGGAVTLVGVAGAMLSRPRV
jgi:drug/metabolite transporter (DMT)-like permease